MINYSNLSWSEIERLIYGKGKTFTHIAFDRVKGAKNVERKLRQEFAASFKKGESFEQLVKRIQKVTGKEASDASRIARTESTRIESLAKEEAARNYMQQTGGNVFKTWVCTFHNSRDSHIALHGETVPFEEDFEAAGGPMAYPGDDSRVGPEEIINCQCYMEITKE